MLMLIRQLYSPCYSSLAEREVLKVIFFFVVSFTIDCIDKVNGKKTGERRVGKCLEQIDCAGSFLGFAWRG